MTDFRDQQPNFDKMERRLIGSVRSRRVLKRRRAALAGAAVVVVGAVGGTAALLLAPRGFSERGAYCYAAADLDSPRTEVALPDQRDGEAIPVTDRVANATDLCASAWVTGLVDGKARATAPQLDVCLSMDQALVTFPAPKREEDSCELLGLERP